MATYIPVEERLKQTSRLSKEEVEEMFRDRFNLLTMWIAKARQAKQNVALVQAEIIKLAWTQGNPDEEVFRVVFNNQLFEITTKGVVVIELPTLEGINCEDKV